MLWTRAIEIARVDGRHVHWVRTWDDGERYSLIFYDTSDRKKTLASELNLETAKDVTCEKH